MLISRNFLKRELACSCCGELVIEPDFLFALQQLRDRFQKPIVINSGFRCEAHNKKVGGKVHSYHVRGLAADLRIKGMDPADKHTLASLALDIFGGIGIHQQFIHVDLRKGKVFFIY